MGRYDSHLQRAFDGDPNTVSDYHRQSAAGRPDGVIAAARGVVFGRAYLALTSAGVDEVVDALAAAGLLASEENDVLFLNSKLTEARAERDEYREACKPAADYVADYGYTTLSGGPEKARHEVGLLARDVQLVESERDDLRAEVERWRDKAQESGAAYANANTKHHAELDRASRLERLADTLAERAVELEDRAWAAEAKVERVKVVADEWERDARTVVGPSSARLFASRLRAALRGES